MIVVLITACASKDTILPVPKQTMADIFQRHGSSGNLSAIYAARSLLRRGYAYNNTALDGYLRNSQNEIRNLFPRLYNPDLVLFVYPHLTEADNLPVPGYSTVFPMFKEVTYAMPGEVTQAYQPINNGIDKNAVGD